MTGAAVSMLSGNIVYCALTEYFFFRQHGLFIHPFASKASARR
jgi:hypothetical protein